MDRIDNQNWVAIQAYTATPAGEIEFVDIRVQGGSYYYELPVELPLGVIVKGTFTMKNTSSVTLIMQAKSWFLSPSNQVRGYSETGLGDAIYLPGEGAPAGTNNATLDEPGTWRFIVELYAEVY